MTVQPFTPTGVEDLVEEVYALPKIDREAQADDVESDPRSWIGEHFDFTTPQQTYFDGMSNEALKYYGQQIAQCFRYELPITLVYPAPPPLSVGKWTGSENKVVVKADGSGDIEVTGELTFTMEYR